MTYVPLNDLLTKESSGSWQERFRTDEDETEVVERIINIFSQTNVKKYNLTIITNGKSVTTMQEEHILRALSDIIINLKNCMFGIGEVKFSNESSGDIAFEKLLMEISKGQPIWNIRDMPFRAFVNKSSDPELIYQSFRFQKEILEGMREGEFNIIVSVLN